MILVKFVLNESLFRAFIMSDLSKLLTVAHLSWATWATWVIRSRSLFWHERPERFAHSCSFVLSESLTAAHLIWVIWANEQSANERIPSPGSKSEYSAILSWIKPLSHVQYYCMYCISTVYIVQVYLNAILHIHNLTFKLHCVNLFMFILAWQHVLHFVILSLCLLFSHWPWTGS